MTERIHATYWLETGVDPQLAAEVIAGEQSSGTFIALPNETPELKARSGARVERLDVLDRADRPSLPGGIESKVYTRCALELSWPIENMGPSLPNLMSTIAGNLFELRQVSGLRLTGLRLPPSFAKAYPGPAFGIEGTRKLAGVEHGPLIGTIIKPSVGLSPEETAQQVRELVAGGIDFIKDDELQGDGPHCPFDERVRAVMRVVNEHADRTGKKAMVAFNVTGDLDQMKRRHDLVMAEGGTCVMAVLNSIGLVGMHELRRHSQLPIHAHRAGWGTCRAVPDWAGITRRGDALASGGRRSPARERPAQQVQRTRRQRDRRGAFGARAGDAGSADARDAGVQLRANRLAGRRHLRGGRLRGPDSYGGRGNLRPPGRRRGGRGGIA